ncbi:type II secretion system protein N [Porticoccus sp. W117]|uniref:type II secretion system protein N n=1 Tax=Porticoccus sp. W117 TaxID=3054777 RepID=UPI0025915099|nr:type II secretion system protein N [Porticoccus sp. W117]MDM3872572.1 type II secretion system protein N [Porticoccus sp. W117]
MTTLVLWVAAVLYLGSTALSDWRMSEDLSQQASLAKPIGQSHSSTATPASSQFSSRAVAQLFGTQQVKAEAPNTKPVKDIPLTRLNLKLIGTFSHSDHKSASALIAHGNKPSKRYYGGETVPGGAELVSVTPSSVILRRNGRDEVLLFPRISPDIKSIQSQVAADPQDKKAAPILEAAQGIAAEKQIAHAQPSSQIPEHQTPTKSPDDTPVVASTTVSRDELKERLKRLRDRN